MRSFLDGATDRLVRSGLPNARLDAELLLAKVLGMRRESIHMQPERPLELQEWDRSVQLVERRMKREPVAYILGKKEFMGLDFAVHSDALIPRWETEGLLERFCQWLATVSFPQPLRLLDMGTGAGNIAVCLAKQFPESQVTAVDVCPKALDLARENTISHGVAERVRLVLSDWFANVEGRYHAILSNPPYIDIERLASLMADVRDHEPSLALNGGGQGLDAYRRLIPEAHSRLVAGGGLFLEIGEDQGEPVCALIESDWGYASPQVIKDYSGCDRIVCTQRRDDG